MKRSLYRCTLAVSALVFSVSSLKMAIQPALGATFNYIAPPGTFGDGAKWQNTSNLSVGNVPGNFDTGNIRSGGQITLLDNRTIDTLNIGSLSTLILQGGLLDVNNLRLGQGGSQGSISRQGGLLRPDKVTITSNSALDIVNDDVITAQTEITVTNIGSNLFYNHADSDRMLKLSLHEGGAATLVTGTLRTSYLDLGKDGGFVPSEIFRVNGTLDVFTNVSIYTGSELKVEAGDVFTPAVINVLGATSKLNLQGNTLTADSLNLHGGILERGAANIHVKMLGIHGGNLEFIAGDTLATNGSIEVSSGGTLNLQASINNRLSGVGVSSGGTLNLNGNTLNTSFLSVDGGTLDRGGGSLGIGWVELKNANLTITTIDIVEPGAVLSANAGSSINYNNAQNQFGIIRASGGTIDLNGHDVQVGQIGLGAGGTINRTGSVLTGIKTIGLTGGSTFTLEATDTTASGGTIGVAGAGSVLNLSTDFAESAVSTSVSDGGVLNLNGHVLKTGALSINGGFGVTPGILNRGGGRLVLSSVNIQSGADFSIEANDEVNAGGTFTILSADTTLTYNNPSTAILERTTIQQGTIDLQGGTLRTRFLDLGASSFVAPGYIERNGGALQVTTSATINDGSALEIGAGDDFGTASLWVRAGASLDLAGSHLPVKNLMLWGTFNRNGGSLDLQSVSVVLGNTMDIAAGDILREGGTISLSGAGTRLDYYSTPVAESGGSGFNLFNLEVQSIGTVSATSITEGATLDLQGGTLRTATFTLGNVFGEGHLIRSGGVLEVVNAANVAGNSTLTIDTGDNFSSASLTIAAGSTLDLAGNALPVSSLALNGTLVRNGGSFILGGISVTSGQNVALANGDTINAGGYIQVTGADAILTAESDLPNTLGSTEVVDGGVLNLNGPALSTDRLTLWGGTLNRGGATVDTQSIDVRQGSSVALASTDTLRGGGSIQILDAGSMIDLHVSPTSTINDTSIYDGGVLNLHGHDFSTDYLTIGGGTLNRAGAHLDVQTINLTGGSTLAIESTDTYRGGDIYVQGEGSTLEIASSPTDAILYTTVYSGGTLSLNGITFSTTNLNLSNGTVNRSGATLHLQNVSLSGGSSLAIESTDTFLDDGNITVQEDGSTLDLAISPSGTLYSTSVYDGGTLNLNGHPLQTYYLQLGSSTAGILNRAGAPLVVQYASVFAGSTLEVLNGDVIGSVYLYGSGSTLSVSAPLSATLGDVTVSTDATLNFNEGAVSVSFVGAEASSAVNFNGTVLSPTHSNDGWWMVADSIAHVQAGGAKFDTNGYDVATAFDLEHDPALGDTPDGGLTKSGNGTLALFGGNFYTGDTTVNGGTLLINGTSGSGAVAVNDGGTLGGTGTIGNTLGAVSINAGGTLAPGASIGTLVIGDIVFAATTSQFNPEIDLGSTLDADLLSVTGSITLTGSTLDLTLLNGPATQSPLTFLLVENLGLDAVGGIFSTINAPPDYITSVNYAFTGTDALGRVGDGNDIAITITAVPEPNTVVLGALGLLGLGIFPRREKPRRA